MNMHEFRNLVKSMFYIVMIVFFMSMFLLVSIYTKSILSLDDKRVNQSKIAIKHSMAIEDRFFVEEFMSQSFEAIEMRVLRTMEVLKVKNFYFEVLEGDRCLHSFGGECGVVSKFAENADAFLYEHHLNILNKSFGTIKILVPTNEFISDLTLLDQVKLYALPGFIIIAVLLLWFKYIDQRIISPYLAKLLKIEKGLAVKKVSRQVAHDIRSPLSVLQSISLEHIRNPDEKRLVQTAISRITNIANDLLNKEQQKQLSVVNIPLKLKESLALKRTEEKFRDIEVTFHCESYSLFSKVDSHRFTRAICNLVNNAADAVKCEESKAIRIECRSDSDYVYVNVCDNGEGVASKNFDKIFDDGFSTKNYGHGLGLNSVKKLVEDWGGSIHLKSNLGVGTEFLLKLPRIARPAWFADTIEIKPNEVAYLDDDFVYREKMSRILDCAFPDTFAEKEDLLEGLDKYSLVFVDYDLGTGESGLDFILKNELQKSSVLLTNMWEDLDLQTRCQGENIRLMPKELFFGELCNVSIKESAQSLQPKVSTSLRVQFS